MSEEQTTNKSSRTRTILIAAAAAIAVGAVAGFFIYS